MRRSDFIKIYRETTLPLCDPTFVHPIKVLWNGRGRLVAEIRAASPRRRHLKVFRLGCDSCLPGVRNLPGSEALSKCPRCQVRLAAPYVNGRRWPATSITEFEHRRRRSDSRGGGTGLKLTGYRAGSDARLLQKVFASVGRTAGDWNPSPSHRVDCKIRSGANGPAGYHQQGILL